MIKAATRHLQNDLAIALAALLLLLFVALNSGSYGFSRNGGGDDSGSGIGGTGKFGPLGGSGESSGSGFGGTGLKPFLGINENNGEVIVIDGPVAEPLYLRDRFEPSLVAMTSQVEAPQVANREIDLISNNAVVDIASEIQYQLDNSALVFAATAVEPFALSNSEVVAEESVLSTNPAERQATPWGILASYLGDEPGELVDEKPQVLADRSGHPDKIQRPELPPIQRIRPVERISVLPPRIQPMRI